MAKMKKLARVFSAILVAAVVMSLGQFNHALAMQSPSAMRIAVRGSASSSEQHCGSSYVSILAKSEDKVQNSKKKLADNEPQPPYYFYCARYRSYSALSGQVIYQSPDVQRKVPLYRLYSVIRR